MTAKHKQAKQSKFVDDEFDKTYPVYSWDDITAHKHNPKHDIMGAKGLSLLFEGGSLVIIGPTGHGKSVATQQMAAGIATGTKVFDAIEVHRAVGVMYYQSDNDIDCIQMDLTSIASQLKLNQKLLRENLHIRRIQSICGVQLRDALARDIQRFNAKVVVIDNYQSFISGDINSTEVFQEWRMAVEDVQRAFGVAVITVAHTTKKTQYESKDVVDPRDSVYLASGTAALSNWVRSSMWLSLVHGDFVQYNMIFGKNAARAGLRNEKGEVVRNLVLKHSRDPMKPFWHKAENQNSVVRGTNADADILKVYKSNPRLTHDEIANLVQPPRDRSTVCRVLKRFIKEGKITGLEAETMKRKGKK